MAKQTKDPQIGMDEVVIEDADLEALLKQIDDLGEPAKLRREMVAKRDKTLKRDEYVGRTVRVGIYRCKVEYDEGGKERVSVTKAKHTVRVSKAKE